METEKSIPQADVYLEQIKAGHTDALAGLYTCTQGPLFSLCYSYLHNIPDSEDALHDAYLSVLHHIAAYRGRDGFNWLFTITKNTCLNALKKKSRTIPTDFDDEMVINAVGADPDAETHIFDESGIFATARRALNDNEFRIVILHAVHHIKFGDIARGLGRPEATVRWQYNNAIKKVRQAYERGEQP